ncbi:MAG: chemotaxis protein CheW [Bryobacterales bacterium]|nr:chemotaxis protein CheW [Bryobacterales bacterium]
MKKKRKHQRSHHNEPGEVRAPEPGPSVSPEAVIAAPAAFDEVAISADLLELAATVEHPPQTEFVADPRSLEEPDGMEGLLAELLAEDTAPQTGLPSLEEPPADAAPAEQLAVQTGSAAPEPEQFVQPESLVEQESPVAPESLVVQPFEPLQPETEFHVPGAEAETAHPEFDTAPVETAQVRGEADAGPQVPSEPAVDPALAAVEEALQQLQSAGLSDQDLLEGLPTDLEFAVEEPTELLLESIGPADAEAVLAEAGAAGLPSLTATDEMFAEMMAEADTLLGETPAVEEAPPVQVGPQPPLEDVIRAIDRELRNAPAFSLVNDAPAVAHRQYSQLDDYVVFSLCGADYAVPVRDIAEIGRIPAISRIPNLPEFVRGLTNLRGEVVPVLSLQSLLGIHETQSGGKGRVLFLQSREGIAATALLVDDVKGIQRIPSQQLEQVTGLMDDKVTSVLRGVHGRGDRLLNILDLEQLFQLQEIRQLENR